MITAAAIVCAPFLSPAALAEEPKETVEYETGFYYTVKKGDTLWDLSQRFADSPWTWPELWKENDQIPNPHQIYPGERIRLFHRDWIDRVSKQQPVAVKKMDPTDESTPIDDAAPVIEAATPAGPVPEYYYTSIDAVGFVRKKAEVPYGTIFKVQQPKAIFSTGDVVYIRKESGGELAANKKYTVFRTLEPLVNKKTREVYGVQHLLIGVVKITSLEPRYAIGIIVKAFRAFHLGDQLMPYEKRSTSIPLRAAVAGLKGVVIAGEERQVLIGEYMRGFIDKGRTDGVMPGQEYLVYYQDSEKVNALDKDPILLAPIDFATLLVLDAEDETATVLVTNARKNIDPLSTFRAPGQ